MGLVRKLLPQLNEYILPYVLVALLLFALSGAAVESLLTEPSTINAYPPGVQVFPDTSVAEGLFYFPPAHERLTSTGKLLRVEAMPSWVAVPKGARAWRILYTSKMPSGSLTVVSGFVVAPSRPSPPGGFPVIAWAHATTGLAYLCAPSRFAYLDIPYLETFIAKGYVVAATDYQGLGTTGTLPYLVGSAEAEALLDSVKAAEQIPLAHASNNVIAFGYSEGGQGALFAGQIAHSYSPSLHLLGVVAEAPPTHLRELMVQIKNSKADLPFYVLLAYAWSDNLPSTTKRHAHSNWNESYRSTPKPVHSRHPRGLWKSSTESSHTTASAAPQEIEQAPERKRPRALSHHCSRSHHPRRQRLYNSSQPYRGDHQNDVRQRARYGAPPCFPQGQPWDHPSSISSSSSLFHGQQV